MLFMTKTGKGVTYAVDVQQQCQRNTEEEPSSTVGFTNPQLR